MGICTESKRRVAGPEGYSGLHRRQSKETDRNCSGEINSGKKIWNSDGRANGNGPPQVSGACDRAERF